MRSKITKYGITILGWIGTVIFLISYILISFGVLRSDSQIILVTNFFSSLLIGLSCIPRRAWQSLSVNFFILVVSVLALLKGLFK